MAMRNSYGTAASTSRRKDHKYVAVPPSGDERSSNDDDVDIELQQLLLKQSHHHRKRRRSFFAVMAVISLLVVLFLATGGLTHKTNASCNTINDGYTCSPEISHFWGQYSPYFSVPSNISAATPAQCKITFAQILSRHGARDPTTAKTAAYQALVNRIHTSATSYSKDYAFIASYNYTLGANELSAFGQQQMINSGIKYYNRYSTLAAITTPFIRASGQDRVVESALNWTQGFHAARVNDNGVVNKTDAFPYPMLIISEEAGQNNTLDHGLCTAFEDSTYGDEAQAAYLAVFMPNITPRLNANLPGVNLTDADALYMMDLCPFTTVADINGAISPFCSLFTEGEWKMYDYYQSVGKYYGYGAGNPLGPTQGVGFTNELIARLTSSAVNDHTSTNSTLDGNITTFPISNSTQLYADFSHDNDMTGIFAVLGLYNSTKPLSKEILASPEEMQGFAASWSVPFAARAYFEKMSCVGEEEELVRVVVNDRVMGLETCGGDALGRCKLSRFVDSLAFTQAGGDWGECFV